MTVNQKTIQAVITDQAKFNANQGVQKLALFNPDGTPYASAAQTGANLPFAPVTTGSAIGTVAKSTSSVAPAPNTLVPIIFTNGNSAAAPTLSFNGGTARPMLLGGTAPLATELTVGANGVVLFWFDGTSLHQLGLVA